MQVLQIDTLNLLGQIKPSYQQWSALTSRYPKKHFTSPKCSVNSHWLSQSVQCEAGCKTTDHTPIPNMQQRPLWISISLSLLHNYSLWLNFDPFFFHLLSMFSTRHESQSGETKKRGKKNREEKKDGVHIIGAVSHSGRAGGSMHPSLRLVIRTLFLSYT